jgi:hypothetical protein
MVDCSFSYFDSNGSIAVELELLSMVPASTIGCGDEFDPSPAREVRTYCASVGLAAASRLRGRYSLIYAAKKKGLTS